MACLASLFAAFAIAHAGGGAPPLDLDMNDAAGRWRVVLDGVMGGRSSGRIDVPAPGVLGFAGLLSLENNGGFAQMRCRVDGAACAGTEAIELRVRGDGRTWQFDIRTADARLMAGGFEAAFETEAEAWTTVRIPYADFELRNFGRRVSDAPPLRPERIESIGVTIADKRSGPFRLEIDRIRAVGGDRDDGAAVAAGPSPSVRVIERAIERGVPIFNGGQPGACAAIYEVAILGLVELGADRLDDVTEARLRLALAEGAEERDDLARAWLFREALDHAHARLSRRPSGVAMGARSSRGID